MVTSFKDAPWAAPTTLYASSEHIMGVKLEQPLLSLVIEQFEFCGAVVKVSMNLMLFATLNRIERFTAARDRS